ncbi:MAG TPA: ribosome-associated translation inhibitor RaiA [Myxococcaceae bacterium]|nr:ribosome-associated translation inhibitor RaiA [Myxococcaceae bacterium]
MHLNITFRNLDASDSLKEHARERVERVNKFLDRAGEAHVVLSLERHLHHADVTLHSGSFVLRGKEKSPDMYTSIDQAVEKIERQLRRYKEKLKSHHNRAFAHHQKEALEHLKIRHNVVALPMPEAEASTASARVIRTNEFVARPMSVDDAVMQMDLMNNDFLVFKDLQSKEVNVLYRRKDGHYGLIEASGSSRMTVASVG